MATAVREETEKCTGTLLYDTLVHDEFTFCPVHDRDGLVSGGMPFEKAVEAWADSPLPEDDAIKAAHPTRTGRHDLYAEAQRLVSARHSKAGLVELVNWLLVQAEQAEDRGPDSGEHA
jgi:hypothetical protein